MEYNFERIDLEEIFNKDISTFTQENFMQTLSSFKWETINITSSFNIIKMSP